MSSKATEILKNLNSQIQHTNPQDANTRSIDNNSIIQPTLDTSNNINPPQSQLITEIPKSKIFEDQLRYQQNREAPQFLTQILQKQIGVLININLSENIQSVLRQRQKNTYDAFTKEGQDNAYIKILYEQSQKKTEFYSNAVSNMLSKRQSKVEGDLEKGGIIIQYDRNLNNKKQLQYLWQADLERMIKIKDGQLRSKLDILNDKMQKFDGYGQEIEEKKKLQQQINKKVLENMDFDNYALDSQKTKIAKDYVRYIQQQKKLLQKKRRQRIKQYQQAQKQRQSQLKQAEEMRDLAKRQQILQRIETRRKKRQQQQKQQLLKQQQVKKLLDQHHKKLPIFKIKQKQYQQRIVKPQKKLYEQKLNEIRDYKKSMSLNEIQTHESKYLGKLQLQQKKREQQLKMILKSRKSEDIIHRYYKGSAHKRIDELTKQQQLRNYSMREASKIKANRMKEYNQVILKLHKPTVDQDKKKQLIKLIQIDLMRKKHVKKIFKQIIDQNSNEVRFQEYFEEIPQKDLYKEGNKFLQYSKQHIKRKQKQTNIQKIQQLQGLSQSKASKVKLLEGSQDPLKKEKNVWQLRAKQLQQFATSDVVDAKVFQYVKQNIQNLDHKAAQKQQMLKKLNLSMEQHINQKGKLDHFYLSSIKQKMRLLQ